MAPQKWTAPRDQNLLLLMIQDIKPNFQDLADKWAHQFPDEDFKPTGKAVAEHVAALKRKMGGSSGVAGTPVTVRSAAPSKPRATNGTPKTPTSSKGKRSRSEMISNEDDSEDEKIMNMMDMDTPAPKRTTPSRHRVARKYKEENIDSENDEEIVIWSVKPTAADSAKHVPGGDADVEEPRLSIARSKLNPPNLGYFKDSDGGDAEDDVSEFEPFV